MLDSLRFIVIQQCNQQHCYARNNKTRFYGIRNSTDIECVLEFAQVKTSFEIARVECVLEFTRVQMCIWLWTPFGLKIKFVSGNRERST
jgi:hypothetical protein